MLAYCSIVGYDHFVGTIHRLLTCYADGQSCVSHRKVRGIQYVPIGAIRICSGPVLAAHRFLASSGTLSRPPLFFLWDIRATPLYCQLVVISLFFSFMCWTRVYHFHWPTQR